MGRKTIISGTTLLFSLGAYYIAKHKGLDRMPVMMLASFIGAIVGEGVAEAVEDTDAEEVDDHELDQIED